MAKMPARDCDEPWIALFGVSPLDLKILDSEREHQDFLYNHE